jgi:hypothetical protein
MFKKAVEQIDPHILFALPLFLAAVIPHDVPRRVALRGSFVILGAICLVVMCLVLSRASHRRRLNKDWTSYLAVNAGLVLLTAIFVGAIRAFIFFAYR